MPKLTLITPTSDRHCAFKLCERWMRRAAERFYGEIQWIVADDGEVPVQCTMGQTHVRRESDSKGKASFLGNLVAALELAEHDKILFIEDDDWYAPDYLNEMDRMLDDVVIAGESNARYYNLQSRRYRRCGNHAHASLCQTGIRSELISWMVDHISAHKSSFIDVHLWRTGANHKPSFLKPSSKLSVGIKGLPGTKGIGIGHRMNGRAQHDANGLTLKHWTNHEDASIYFGLTDQKTTESNPTSRSRQDLRSGLAIMTFVSGDAPAEVRKRLPEAIRSLELSNYSGPVFIVDDGSNDPVHLDLLKSLSSRYEVILRKTNGGQCLAGNTCLRVLMESEIEVGFIAHDDIEFLPNWSDAYLFSHSTVESVHHYSWARDRHPKLRMKKAERVIDGHVIAQTSRLDGAFLSFTPEVIERVGGFKILPAKWGHTHTNWTRRIIEAGLAPYYADIINSNDYLRINSYGEHSTVRESDRQTWQRMNRAPAEDLSQVYHPLEE